MTTTETTDLVLADAVPDAIHDGTLYGWRYWELNLPDLKKTEADKESAYLGYYMGMVPKRHLTAPPDQLVSAYKDIAWPAGGLEATCLVKTGPGVVPDHTAPNLECQCGIYLFAELDTALLQWSHSWTAVADPSRNVLGAVACTHGLAVEHETGYRVARAAPALLVVDARLHRGIVAGLSRRYAVPIVTCPVWKPEAVFDQIMANPLIPDHLKPRRAL